MKKLNQMLDDSSINYLQKSKNEGYVRDFIRDSITKEDGS